MPIGGFYDGIYRGGLVQVTDRRAKEADGLILPTDGEQGGLEHGDKVSFRLAESSFGYFAAGVVRRP